MKLELKETNSYSREILIDLPWEEITDDFEKALKKIGKKINLPGFRPGKIPRKVLMQNYQQIIEADFIEDSVNTYFFKALQEKELYPVNKADVSDVHFHYGEHFRFKAAFEIEPEITLPRLKRNSLKVELTKYIIDDEDIDIAIEDMRRVHMEVRTIEDGAMNKDFVICDLQELDSSGVPIIGKKLETRYVHIGEGSFGGDNQKKLEGVKPGDKVHVNVPINEQGQTADFELTVKNVERQILPEVNDEFAKLADPEAKDVADLRSRTKVRLEEAFANRAEDAFDRQLSDALIELAEIEYPPSMVDSYLDHMVEDIRSGENTNIDENKLREVYRSVAERNLKWYLMRKTIVQNQALKVTKEEVKTEVERLKGKNPEQAMEMEKHYKKPSNRTRLEDDLMEKKILAFLKEFSKIKEVKIHTKDLRKQVEKEV